jgi:hypothetical protein
MAIRVWKEIDMVGQCIPFKRRSEQECRFEMGNRGGAGESPGWWLCVGAAAEGTHATNNMSSRRIVANQSKSGSEATQRPTP